VRLFIMKFSTGVLITLLLSFCLRAQNIPATRPQGPGAASAQRNPFEAVTTPPQPTPVVGPTIEAIEFRGAKRIPLFALRATINSRVGGPYDVATLRRDAQALHDTGRFSGIVWETEPGTGGRAAIDPSHRLPGR
jgi:outer membrane protein assembly factor BamA